MDAAFVTERAHESAMSAVDKFLWWLLAGVIVRAV
jgi:hypothetical protein